MIHGFYYDAHRAQIDVDALGLLLSFCDPEGKTLIEYLRDAAKDSRHTINAFVRFEDKDILKSNGFYWNAEFKSWDRTVTGSNLKDLLEWLNQNLPTCRARITEILPRA
jgi:DNA polymerase-3 subunit epsilon